MKSSTRKLIGRIRHLIRDAAEGSRRTKAVLHTPWHQRPPQVPEPVWSERAHILCATRAAMRGKLHRPAWLTLEAQHAAIEQALEAAVTWEARLKEPRVHLTFPNWLRGTIRDALKAAVVEREQRPKREARHQLYTATQRPLTKLQEAS